VKPAFLRALLAATIVFATILIGSAGAQTAAPRVLAVQFENDVNPVTQGYLTDEIARANREHYDAIAIVMDTPGGLSESMRKIVKAELASKVPVIVYVSPNGSRAASAGVWLGRHPRDGAADEHRLIHADQRGRHEHPE
jgi:membrane-bound serine protease (ClpP class)